MRHERMMNKSTFLVGSSLVVRIHSNLVDVGLTSYTSPVQVHNIIILHVYIYFFINNSALVTYSIFQ